MLITQTSKVITKKTKKDTKQISSICISDILERKIFKKPLSTLSGIVNLTKNKIFNGNAFPCHT